MEDAEIDTEEREAYEPPAVEDLGSLAELTQGIPGEPVEDNQMVGSV